MIEINLLPDVKREYLKAVRVRNMVISVAILVTLVAIGVVALMAFWMVTQEVRDVITTNGIKDESKKLNNVEAIDEAVTIQNQLASLNSLHSNKVISSRFFDMLVAINPAEPNNIAISNVTIDTSTRTVDMQAQATGGYTALEAFRKTIEATELTYSENGETQKAKLASQISESERNYASNAENTKVLTFRLTFVYDEQLTSNTATNLKVVGPAQRNATDSYIGVPSSLFVQSATQTKEDN